MKGREEVRMRTSKERFEEMVGGGSDRVLDKDLFLFLLDLEVKRARRYQNFICLLLPKLKPSSKSDNEAMFQNYYQTLVTLLTEEMRETDIVGSLGKNQLAILLPYADISAGGHAKSRFENALKYYNLNSNGFEVIIDQVCFPINATDTHSLLQKALGPEAS